MVLLETYDEMDLNNGLFCCVDASNGALHRIVIPNSPDELEKQLRRVFQVHPDAEVQLMNITTGLRVTTCDLITAGKSPTLYVKLCGNSDVDPLRQYDSEIVTFHEVLYGMTIREEGNYILVKKFVNKADGTMGRAEASRQIHVGDALRKIDGTLVMGCKYNSVIEYLRSSKRPIDIEFFAPKSRTMNDLIPVEFTQKSLDMTISSDASCVFVKKADPSGYAGSHGVLMGDRIHAIQGEILYGSNYTRAIELLKVSERPLIIIFRRLKPPLETQVINLEDVERATSSTSNPLQRLSCKSTDEASSSNYILPRKEISWPKEMLKEYCVELYLKEKINAREKEKLLDFVTNRNIHVIRAIESKHAELAIALVRSCSIETSMKSLSSHETLLLAENVRMQQKEYDLLLTDHPRLLLISASGATTIISFGDILGYQLLHTFSFSLDTVKQRYFFSVSQFSARCWINYLSKYTVLQGYLKVESRNSRYFTKKRYFVLDGKNLWYYKTKDQATTQGQKMAQRKLLFYLNDFRIEIADEKTFAFRITCTESQQKLSTILSAATGLEFSHWVTALRGLQRRNTSS